jgi:hypothetical protein
MGQLLVRIGELLGGVQPTKRAIISTDSGPGEVDNLTARELARVFKSQQAFNSDGGYRSAQAGQTEPSGSLIVSGFLHAQHRAASRLLFSPKGSFSMSDILSPCRFGLTHFSITTGPENAACSGGGAALRHAFDGHFWPIPLRAPYEFSPKSNSGRIVDRCRYL